MSVPMCVPTWCEPEQEQQLELVGEGGPCVLGAPQLQDCHEPLSLATLGASRAQSPHWDRETQVGSTLGDSPQGAREGGL